LPITRTALLAESAAIPNSRSNPLQELIKFSFQPELQEISCGSFNSHFFTLKYFKPFLPILPILRYVILFFYSVLLFRSSTPFLDSFSPKLPQL
jgi:hypothetical protein